MLVRYDSRGTGMSQRAGVSFSLEAFMLDVQAVVNHLGLDRFALLGFLHSGLIAIPYAIQHPEQVSHVVLWCSHGPLTEYASSRREALHSLIDRDWELFTETIAHTRLGWSGGADTHEIAAYLRESLTPDQTHVAYAAVHELEVMTLLSRMKSPTLVFHRRELPVVKVSVAMDLASGIPDAQLIVLEGASAAPYLDDMEDIAGSIEEFLGIAGAAPVQAVPFRTVLFTDIADSTEMMQRLGDEKGREVLREHERITREVLKANGGTEVKTMGDGFMASFSSVTKAVECAIALQRAFAERNAALSAHPERAEGAVERAPPQGAASGAPTPPEPLHVRIGLNAGEPIEEEGPDGRSDLFGATVILAARIAAQAEGGEVLASLAVRELCAGKGFLFADRGEHALRGFEDRVRLFEVRWRG